MADDLEDFARFWPRSDRLGEARCYAFQCADILELYCDTVIRARQERAVFVAILGENDQPLVLIPLSIEQRHNIRILRFLDGGLSDLNAPVLFGKACDWTPVSVRMIWQQLRNILRFDAALLEKMPAEVGDLRNPLILPNASENGASCHAMSLSGGWRDVEAKLPRQRQISRSRRRLARHGVITFKIAESPEDYAFIREAFERQKTRRYIETRGTDGLARPGYRPFLASAGRLLYPDGPVCLFALKVDHIILATVLGYVVGRRFYYFMPSFEGGHWGTYSAGHILISMIAEWCCAKGLDTFDFGLGDEEYKREYCNIAIALYRSEVAATVRGQVYLHARKAWREGRRMKERLLPFVRTPLS